MRKMLLPLVAAMAIASPAMANEARFETRGGVYWEPGNTEGTIGVAAGYDFDLGTAAFAGAEVSADKILQGGRKVAFGFGGRAGVKPTETSKLYATAGYTTKSCDLCEDAVHAGAGFEQAFGTNMYGKLEYRHLFTSNGAPDSNAVLAGVGVRF